MRARAKHICAACGLPIPASGRRGRPHKYHDTCRAAGTAGVRRHCLADTGHRIPVRAVGWLLISCAVMDARGAETDRVWGPPTEPGTVVDWLRRHGDSQNRRSGK